MDIYAYTLLSVLILRVVDTSHFGVPCKNFEVLVCGDTDQEWSVCGPKTPGVHRIISAQLDTRFANRYCRRYGTPENFGLTKSGRAMWTVGWCYGTFFLCLELDTTTPPDVTSSQATKQHQNTKISTSTTNIFEKDAKTIAGHNMNYVDDSEKADKNISEDKLSQSGSQKADNCSSNGRLCEENIVRKDTGLDPHLKFWLIFAITTGGLIIVILIAVIAYLTMQCCDANTEEAPVCTSKKTANKMYFRQQKLSTSALMTSESDYCTDVYDFIPADNSKKCRKDREKCRKFNNIRHGPLNKRANQKKEYAINHEEGNKTSPGNDYFVLIPHNFSDISLHSRCSNNNGQVYAHITENIYDHLLHSPAVSLPDTSTYHHLNFHRDACKIDKNEVSKHSTFQQDACHKDTSNECDQFIFQQDANKIEKSDESEPSSFQQDTCHKDNSGESDRPNSNNTLERQ